MVECEKKILLSREEYLVVKSIAPKCTQTIKQTNYYYDTDNFKMNKKGITCRIREKNGKYVATIKNHKIGKKECSLETSKEVRDKNDNSLFEKLNVKYQGKLTTTRTTMLYNHRVKVMIDKNTYLGVTDYELEVEYIPEEEKYAERIIRCLAQVVNSKIPQTDIEDFCKRTKKSKNKSERFFKRKKRIKVKEIKKENKK